MKSTIIVIFECLVQNIRFRVVHRDDYFEVQYLSGVWTYLTENGKVRKFSTEKGAIDAIKEWNKD